MTQIGDSIMWAIKNGDLDQVKELIEQSSFNVNQEITARSPIHYAAGEYNYKVFINIK